MNVKFPRSKEGLKKNNRGLHIYFLPSQIYRCCFYVSKLINQFQHNLITKLEEHCCKKRWSAAEWRTCSLISDAAAVPKKGKK